MKCKFCSMEGKFEIKSGPEAGFYCGHHLPKNRPESKNTAKSKSLSPFFVVILFIISLSSIRQVIQGIDIMMLMMDFMGYFLVVFGMFKLYDINGFVNGFITYDLLAKKAKLYAYFYPFIEVGLGLLYLLGYMFVWQNLIVLTLSFIGMISAYLTLKKREEIMCVCLGTAFNLPMTWVTFIENALMGAMVVFMLL